VGRSVVGGAIAQAAIRLKGFGVVNALGVVMAKPDAMPDAMPDATPDAIERLRADEDVVLAAITAIRVPLRQSLVARYGVAVGSDATANAVAWAWEHQAEFLQLRHPFPYLHRVGQSSVRSTFAWNRRTRLDFPIEPSSAAPGDPFADVTIQANSVVTERIRILRWTHTGLLPARNPA
jgi:hypothetical protein